MRSHWLLSVAMCLLGTGIALAQPKKPPLTSTGEPRTAIPADVKTPVNRLPECPIARGFAAEGEERAVLPEVGRSLLQGERGQRGYMTPEHAPRGQSSATPNRDSTLLRVQPGEKTNRIPDRPAERNLLPSDTSRENLLPRTTGPGNRQGTQERRAIER